ncbi:hypothetical protein ACIBO2_52420 [Nonomuraea sp. NPDC050022]|uniref:hypothetical protein n=1 Tax=unclassified Nonomuraea TaxID=2593643 RepID=UPI0034051E31
MKFTFKAEISPPPWLMAVIHTVVAGGGVVYMEIAQQPTVVTTAIVFIMGVSYGRILTTSARRRAVETKSGHA